MSAALPERSDGPAAASAAPDPAAEPRAALRARLLAQFESWLDETLAAEPLPPGLDGEVVAEFLAANGAQAPAAPPDGCSLYDLWAAMTALTQDVKLQGRTFRQLAEAVAPVADLDQNLRAVLAAHGEAMAVATRLAGDIDAARNERQRQAVREAEQRAAKTLLEALMDARDRLKRGVATAQASDRVRLGRLSAWLVPSARRAAEAGAALAQGYEMALARLDECLREHGIREGAALGAPFDPKRMRAVEAVVNAEVADGTVLEVLRCGYESDAGVVRVADVRVSRRP